MKKLLILGLFIILLAFIGCESEIAIEAPSNLTVKVTGADSLGLAFSWDPSPTSGIDGYRLYWDEDDSLMWEGTQTTCALTNPPIGTFYVTAYKGTKSESDPSNEINTAPVTGTNQGPIYYISDTSPDHPSAYYWNEDGTGSTVALSDTANKYKADMYLDAEDCLASPSILGSNYHTTGFKESSSTFDALETADLTGYTNATTVVSANKVYVLWLTDTKQYVKIEISNYNATTHSITFRYALQKIPGYRRFK